MAYTAGDTLVRAVMEASTGLPKDRIVNDFAFQAAGAPDSTDITNMIALVDAFYRTNAPTLAVAVGAYLSPFINRAATHKLALYHIVAGDLGSPFYEEAWLGPPDPSTSTGLPAEVAGVLSFHADLTGVVEESGTTRPKARRRGRIYLGPLIPSAVLESTPPYRLSSTGFLDVVRKSAVRLMDDSNTDGVPWCVWSRKDATLRPVVGGWTDDAPDTQRRRGPSASARVVWG